VLGIETSCDDTSVALYDDGAGVLENLVSSQVDLHGHFGGVVPELASRAHLVNLLPLVDYLLERQGVDPRELDGVAVTAGPGLIGALLVGLSTAKAICWATGRPLVGVHHIEGHILANQLIAPMTLPAAVLVVSGGHTEVVLMRDVGRYERLGWTLDDAAGECFDKTAQLLGLPYPGGPVIDRLAAGGRAGRFELPRPLARDPRVVFSFSGLKTAVRTLVTALPKPLSDQDVADLCHALREAVVDVLVTRLAQAAREHEVQALYLAGGVAANSLLRERTASEAARTGLKFLPPELAYCTDNAAMIACAGQARLAAGFSDPLTLDSFARRPLQSWR
jgi:N6-L-threonylcarbamoyladenine synthase